MRGPVELDPRHIARLPGHLPTGIMELVRDAIDADALDIEVVLK